MQETVACWKTCCCVHADSSRPQNKRVGNYVVIKFMQRKTSWGLGRGHCPLPRNFFSILSLKWRLLVHSGCLPTRRGGHGPSRPPLDPIRQWSNFRLSRACDLHLRSGDIAYRHASLVDRYIHTYIPNFIEIGI